MILGIVLGALGIILGLITLLIWRKMEQFLVHDGETVEEAKKRLKSK